jgi:hypothetical protein
VDILELIMDGWLRWLQMSSLRCLVMMAPLTGNHWLTAPTLFSVSSLISWWPIYFFCIFNSGGFFFFESQHSNFKMVPWNQVSWLLCFLHISKPLSDSEMSSIELVYDGGVLFC